jgi:DNA-binding PadR family transcriptional regulator
LRISKTDMAILGMLTVEPMSGYDMKRFCEQSLTHFWHESYGNLYPRLRRLTATGLVRKRTESRPHAPDAFVYSVTARGRKRFRQWLHEPAEPERVRSALLLKLFFGAEAPDAIAALLHRELEQQTRVRAEYRAIERLLDESLAARPQTPYWRLALRRGLRLTEARLRWCRESIAQLAHPHSLEDR